MNRILFLLFLFKSSLAEAQLSYSRNDSDKYIRTPDGIKLYYRIVGNKSDTLIFLHGGPGSNSQGVSPDLEPIAKHHTLIIYDQRGCGRSDLGDSALITVGQHVDDLETIRKYFLLEKMTIVGHSWGCMLATFYVTKFPLHVKRLLLLAPGPPTRKLFQERFAAYARRDSVGQAKVAKLRQQLETSTDPLSLCKQITDINEKLYYANEKNISKKKGSYCDVPVEAFRKQALTGRLTLQSLGNYDLQPLLGRIKQPALIIEGAQTPVPIKEFRIWAATLPNSRILLINGVGHAYPFVEQPSVFFTATEKFLRGKWPEGSIVLHGKKILED